LSTVATSSAAGILAQPAFSLAFGDAARAGFFDLAAVGASLAWQDQGVLNVAKSPFAKLHSVPVRAVTIEEGFWSKRPKDQCRTQHPDDAPGTRGARSNG
jgi:hypothetical protein